MKSSKDVARKPGQPNNPARTSTPNRTPQSNQSARAGSTTSTPGRPATRPAAQARPGTQSQTRPGAQRRPVQKKGGFRLRPVDAIFTGVVVLVIGLIVFAIWQSAPPPPAGGADTSHLLANGSEAPDFNLPGTDGKTYTLSQFKGKPVALEFMAPWCPHCQEDSTVFNKIYNDYKGKGLVMLGINASPYGKDAGPNTKPTITMDDQKWFVQTFTVPYPLLFDAPFDSAGSLDMKQRQTWGIDYFPTVYFIDKTGKISDHMLADVDNPITYDRMAKEVDNIIK